MKKTRTYSPQTLDAARILGIEVARARRGRQWTVKELAARAGITPHTLRKVENGDPTVGLGTAFEVALLVGVPLFDIAPERLGELAAQANDRLMLLPQRVRQPNAAVPDDF